MGVQFHAKRWKQFEAYRFVSEKQQLGYLSGEQVGQVMAGRVVVSVVIVMPYYSIITLRQRSLATIASLLLQSDQGNHFLDSDGDDDSMLDRVDRLGLPVTLKDSLMKMLTQ